GIVGVDDADARVVACRTEPSECVIGVKNRSVRCESGAKEKCAKHGYKNDNSEGFPPFPTCAVHAAISRYLFREFPMLRNIGKLQCFVLVTSFGASVCCRNCQHEVSVSSDSDSVSHDFSLDNGNLCI